MNIYRHEALHKLFGMLLTPKEQLKELRCLYEGVLSHTANQLFNELLSLEDSEFYIKDIVKHGKRAKGQRDKGD